MSSRTIVRLLAIGLLAGAGAMAAFAGSTTVAPPKGDPALGKKVFSAKNCATCHKADGSGGFKLSGNPTPNWRDAKRMADPKYDDAYLRDCIVNGKIKSGMVAWGKTGQIKPEQIEHLIAYIHTFAAPAKK